MYCILLSEKLIKMENKKPMASAPIDIPSKARKMGPEGKYGSEESSHFSNSVPGSAESRMSPYITARRLLRQMSSNANKSSIGNSRVNIVADACTVLPSLASSFSLEVQPLSPKFGKKLTDVKNNGEINQVGQLCFL